MPHRPLLVAALLPLPTENLLESLIQSTHSDASTFTKHLQKHFIFDYDGEEYELYED